MRTSFKRVEGLEAEPQTRVCNLGQRGDHAYRSVKRPTARGQGASKRSNQSLEGESSEGKSQERYGVK